MQVARWDSNRNEAHDPHYDSTCRNCSQVDNFSNCGKTNYLYFGNRYALFSLTDFELHGILEADNVSAMDLYHDNPFLASSNSDTK